MVIAGGASDREEALRAAESLPVMVVAGEATLQEMMNIIAHSRMVVSIDTGMAHIAAQLGKPLVVMRTCVGRAWWLPGNMLPMLLLPYSRTTVSVRTVISGRRILPVWTRSA